MRMINQALAVFLAALGLKKPAVSAGPKSFDRLWKAYLACG
jgi:hypothetical protein